MWPRVRDGNWDGARLDLRTGKETRPTTATIDWGPVISKSRRTIMYTRIVDDTPTLRVMAANGDGDRLLVEQPPKGCSLLSRPAAASVGQLVVTCNTEAAPATVRLIVITLEDRLVRQLDKGRIGDPTVTPDGRSVLYWRNAEGSRDGGALYRIPLDGSGSRVRLTDGGDGKDADPVVSPDGRQLAFSREAGAKRVVMTAPFDGRTLTGAPPHTNRRGQRPGPVLVARRAADRYKGGPSDNGDLYVRDLVGRDCRRVVNKS